MSKADVASAARALREELRAEGYFERRPLRGLAHLFAHLALTAGGVVAFLAMEGLPLRVVAIAVTCFGGVGAGAVGHTASHYALVKSRALNEALTFFTYPFFLMLSATYWQRSHVQLHHPSPNIVGIDDDCDLRPMFALNHEHERAGSWPERHRRLFALLLPVLLVFNVPSIYLQGIQHVARELRKAPARRQPRVLLDAVCMALHPVLWLGLPLLWFSPLDVLAIYVLRVAIMGYGLFAILAPGHYPAEASCLDPSLRGENFFVRQTTTTINFRTSWLGHFLCAGLEYQIEHHLFPAVSHVHYRTLGPRIQTFCAANGLPHRTLGWGEALWKSWRVFFAPKPVLSSLSDLRDPGSSSRDRPVHVLPDVRNRHGVA